MADLKRLIALKIKPLYNINKINVKIDIENHGIKFYYDGKKNRNNLRARNQYYLIFFSRKGETTNIDLIMNERDNIPISYLNYYEYPYYFNEKYISSTSKEVKAKKKDNKFQILSSYKIINRNAGYLFAEIIPNFDIDYLKIIVNTSHFF